MKFQKKMFSKLKKEIMNFNPNVKIEEGFTPPSSWYNSKDIFELEKKAIFMNNWIGTRGDEKLKEEDSFVTGEIIGQPYVITNPKIKDLNSKYKAFYNVCVHKGAHVASGCGKAKEFACPYHGWTYNNCGSLTKATSLGGIKNFKNKDNSLKSIACQTLNYMNFLNFSENANIEDFKKQTNPVIENLRDFKYDETLGDLSLIGRREYTLETNWKLYIDNFNDDDYHIPYLHKGVSNWNYVKTDSTTVYDKCIIQLSKFKDSNPKLGLGGVYCYIYPNTMIGRFGENLHSIVAEPISEKLTNIVIESYIISELKNDSQKVEESLKFIEVLHLEDTWICKSVQKGLDSEGFDKGRYSPFKEHGTHAFHLMLYNDLYRFV